MSDLFFWILAVIGTLGCVYLLYVHGWDLEDALFGHTFEDEDDDMDTRIVCTESESNRLDTL